MKAIILAAGYATRLYPLTLHTPKGLLEVAGRTLLDHILEKVEEVEAVNEAVIVTNAKFYSHFLQWHSQAERALKITVLNDGTDSEETRLGALGDLHFAVQSVGISEDILVLAADNLMEFSLADFYAFYQAVGHSSVCVREILPHEVKKMGIVVLDAEQRIIDFEEKPEHPKTHIGAYAIYMYKKEILSMLDAYLESGNNPDAPGYFPAWLCQRVPVYGYRFPGQCYDIGTPEAYAEVQEIYRRRKPAE